MKIYQHRIRVHWGHTDPARIVFYPHYFSWMDESAQLLFDSVGLGWTALKEKYGVPGLPLVEAKSRFVSPSRFGDEIVVESSVAKWNDKTLEVSHKITNAGKLAVEGMEIRVWAAPHPEDPSRLKAVSIPEEVRKAFD
jgi:4-hydroxybenzoyl-CoA thioesterase